MQITKHLLLLALIILSGKVNLFSQTAIDAVLQNTQVEELQRISQEFQVRDSIELETALQLAKLNNWPIEIEDENTYMQLVGLNDDGSPRYNETFNRVAANSISTNKLHSGGGKGLNLEGQNMTVAEWDGGGVRATHREFGNRVTRRDNASGNNAHATHVGGTLIASGVTNNAKGMAPKANLWAYDWNNDGSEMADAASRGIMVSNHSYGTSTGWTKTGNTWYWWGNISVSQTEDYKFGFYDSRTRDWDRIARLAPYYLIVKAAGNDRNDKRTGSHRVWNGSSWITSSAQRDDDGDYDCVSTYATAKNILTVGAVNDLANGYVTASGVRMSNFSSWGPTDDGRIKPDIVGNGVGVYSCNSTGDAAYYNSNGTSMSSPSVAGSCLLLQQHYNNVNSKYMKAATLKGLVIHSADEAGTAAGPDYIFGWGLMNSAKAVDVISDSKIQLEELTLNSGSKYEKVVFSNGTNPIRVTICWTDIEGVANSPSVDPTNIKLVNDLDVRLVNINNNTIYYPYRMNPLVPTAAATKGDNFRDNVEQIYYPNIPAGNYYLRVTNKGNLSGGKQDFSLIGEGFIDGPRADFVASSLTGCIGDTVFFTDKSSNGVSAWQWLFGAATPSNSSLQNPYAVYTNPGVYTVTLRGFDGVLFDTKTVQITIGDIPDASVIESDTAYCVSERGTIVLTPVEKNGKWNGGTWMPYIDSCKFRPSGLQPGDYAAIHTLTNAQGCEDEKTITVKIRANPEVSLSLEKPRVCSDDEAFDIRGGDPAGGVYSIDGDTSSRFNPKAFATGIRRISYVYVDSNNCEGTAQDFIRLEECTNSIGELNASKKVQVFPNPFTSVIEIRNISKSAALSVSDVMGRKVDFKASIQPSGRQIELLVKSEGVYFLSVIDEDGTAETIRIVKQ